LRLQPQIPVILERSTHVLISRFARHTVSVAAGGALALAGLAATPASAASSGHVFSTNRGAEGWYYHGNERVYACDIRTDGYSALTQVFSKDDRLLVSVRDTFNNNKCSWKTPVLFEGTHKIRVCLVKGNQKPTKCGSKREWYVG
jgi:hypothetical protein